MAFELDPSDLPPLSRSSSTYSDDYITTTNSNGTLVHHRSHLRPVDDGGTPVPYHQIRGRVLGPSSSFSLVYGEGVPADRLGIDQSFETIEEAEARRRWSATLARAETPPHSTRSVADENTTPEDTRRAVLADIDFNDIGPRPPTPPRLRPRIHGINNRFSVSSAADSWVTMSEDQDRMSGDFARANPFHEIPITPLRVVQSADVLRPKRDASEYMLPPTHGLRSARSLRQVPHDFHRQRFPSRPQNIYAQPPPVFSLGRSSMTDSSPNSSREVDPDEIISLREALGPSSSSSVPAPTPAPAVQHRVAKDRYGQLVIDTIMEAPEESTLQAVIPERKLLPAPPVQAEADVDKGYGKSEYVTNLQAAGEKEKKKEKKSKNPFKKMFCFPKK